MKICFFGTLPPLTERLSAACSGMVILLSRSPEIEKIDFFGQTGGRIPEGAIENKISLSEPWSIDSPVSLIRTIFRLARKTDVDAFFFNQSLTMFGKRKLSNVIGLLMPTIVAKISRKRVIVYMHDFIETEEPSKLGYKVNLISKVTASLLEKLLIDNTTLIVPRPSQKNTLEKKYRKNVKSLLIPYLEGVQSIMHELTTSVAPAKPRAQAVNILMFGKWGPQKDLQGGLDIISRMMRQDSEIRVTLAGNVNPNFPSYIDIVRSAMDIIPRDSIDYIPEVPEEAITSLFSRSDILFLPYFGSGGYSGVMNLGALYGLKIVAYDVEQLRESDSLINGGTTFIDPGSPEVIKQMLQLISEVRANRGSDRLGWKQKIALSTNAIGDVITNLSNTETRKDAAADNRRSFAD